MVLSPCSISSFYLSTRLLFTRYTHPMVVLRLSRVGKKSHATFRIVASDKQKDTVGTYLELLGSYDPHINPTRIVLKEDRIKYWLSVGAQPSDSVHNLLVEKGVLATPKRVIAKAAAVQVAEAPAETPAAPVETPAEATPAPVAEEKAA